MMTGVVKFHVCAVAKHAPPGRSNLLERVRPIISRGYREHARITAALGIETRAPVAANPELSLSADIDKFLEAIQPPARAKCAGRPVHDHDGVGHDVTGGVRRGAVH